MISSWSPDVGDYLQPATPATIQLQRTKVPAHMAELQLSVLPFGEDIGVLSIDGQVQATGIQGDYFFWLDSQNEQEAFPLFGSEALVYIDQLSPANSFAPEVAAVEDLLAPVLDLQQDVLLEALRDNVLLGSSPPVLSPASPVEEDYIDPDAFLDEYLNSPEGKAILEHGDLLAEELLDGMKMDVMNPILEGHQGQIFTTLPENEYKINTFMQEKMLTELTNVDMAAFSPAARNVRVPSSDDCLDEDASRMDEEPSTESSPKESSESEDDSSDPEWSPSISSPESCSKTKRSRGSPRRGAVEKKTRGRKKRRSDEERKERKKNQNRTAAVRYREKKRSEEGSLVKALTEVQQNNVVLRTQVGTVKDDIRFLKQLMVTVLQGKMRKS